ARIGILLTAFLPNSTAGRVYGWPMIETVLEPAVQSATLKESAFPPREVNVAPFSFSRLGGGDPVAEAWQKLDDLSRSNIRDAAPILRIKGALVGLSSAHEMEARLHERPLEGEEKIRAEKRFESALRRSGQAMDEAERGLDLLSSGASDAVDIFISL